MNRTLIGLLALTLAACAGLAARQSQPKDVSATALWASLKAENYAATWKIWPGKGKFYQGREPHGMLLTTYVNDLALGAIQGKKGTMPPGAIVVKENYTPQRQLAAVTVMWKVQGYNPSAGDWFWAKYGPNGAVQKAGKVAGCINCHGKAAGNDYLFTGSLR
ncbi:cytochrome P460 family protein [Deferrisoma sp.]